MNVAERIRLRLPVLESDSKGHPLRKRVGQRASGLTHRALQRRAHDGLVVAEYPDDAPKRPRTRGECYTSPRPCPFVSCRHHLYLEVRSSGGLRINFPDRDGGELEPSCSLDIADTGQLGTDYIARVLNLSHERVRQVLVVALEKLFARARRP